MRMPGRGEARKGDRGETGEAIMEKRGVDAGGGAALGGRGGEMVDDIKR
jgi:hypothetical protein